MNPPLTLYCPTCRVDVVSHDSGRCLWCRSAIGCETCGAKAEFAVAGRRYCAGHIEAAETAVSAGRRRRRQPARAYA